MAESLEEFLDVKKTQIFSEGIWIYGMPGMLLSCK